MRIMRFVVAVSLTFWVGFAAHAQQGTPPPAAGGRAQGGGRAAGAAGGSTPGQFTSPPAVVAISRRLSASTPSRIRS